MSSNQVPHIFAAHRRAARFDRARKRCARAEAAAYILDDMIEDVIERVEFMRLPPGDAVIVGDLTGSLAPALENQSITARNISPASHDEERPWQAAPAHYLISLGTLDTLNDLPGALLHYRNALSENGILIAQMLGAGSLPTLRQIMLAADGERPAARIHPQIDNRAATALLERAGFRRQVVDSHTLTVRFSSFERMVNDLRDQALTSVLVSQAPYVGKPGLVRAKAAFDALRDEEGRVTETFELLTLTGWR